MAKSAEISANANSVATLDFDRITETASNFAIPPTGLISEASWRLIGNLGRQNLTGTFSGISTGHEDKETEEEREERKFREKLSNIVLLSEIDRMIAEIEKQIADYEKQIAKALKNISNLREENVKLLAEIKKLKTIDLPANDAAREAIHKSYETYCDGLKQLLDEDTQTTLDRLKEIEGTFITVRADIEGIDGPRRYIVFKDAQGENYIKHPKTGEALYINKLDQPKMKLVDKLEGKSYSMQDDIAMQEAQKDRRFGNDAHEGEVEWFYDGQNDLLKSLPEGDLRNDIIGFRDTLRYQEIQLFKLDQDREKIIEKIARLEEKLTANERSIAGNEKDIEIFKKKIKALEQQKDLLNERRNELISQTTSTQQYTQEKREELTKLFTRAAKMQKAGKTDAEIIRELKEMDKSKTDALATIAMQMFKMRQNVEEKQTQHTKVTEVLDRIEKITKDYPDRHEFLKEHFGINVFAIGKAWLNPITLGGEGIYRDNETGQLYTYDKETGRTTIENPAIVAELYERAYVDGELFMNETPRGDDESNSFSQTWDDKNLSTEKTRAHLKSAEAKAEFNLQAARGEAAQLEQQTGISLSFARNENAGELSLAYNKNNTAQSNAPTKTNILQENQTLADLSATHTPQ
ncbi:MAG: hypothetical protein H6860_01690 [Rhodospirillales bacterium]|nr:hypothetical protein [Alphaproteobacteria bacterium]MCB9981092.1 hypothetical protein [Rhodospirillales bacterium]